MKTKTVVEVEGRIPMGPTIDDLELGFRAVEF